MERKAIFSYDSEPWDKTDYTVLIPVELLSFCNIEFFIFTAGEIKNRLKLMVVAAAGELPVRHLWKCVCVVHAYIFLS